MSTRIYCDACGSEIRTGENYGPVNERWKGTHKRQVTGRTGRTHVAFELKAVTGGSVAVSDLCLGCLIDAVVATDPRARGEGE